MENQRLALTDIYQFGQLLLGLGYIYDLDRMVPEQAKPSIHMQVNRGGLDAALTERLDYYSPFGNFLFNASVGKDHQIAGY
jgi:hypothetical protein